MTTETPDHIMADNELAVLADRVEGPFTPTADRRIHWRCFHCGEAFTKAQRRWALQHFGADESALPACQMRVPGEHHLLEYLRKAETELDAYRQEDTELHRAIHAMASDHYQALRRAEEDGYNKGLNDGRIPVKRRRSRIPTPPRIEEGDQ